jgi:hypothetical protein
MMVIASDARRRDFLLRRRRRGACCCYPPWFLGLLWLLEKKALVGKDLKAKGLVKSWGYLRFYL